MSSSSGRSRVVRLEEYASSGADAPTKQRGSSANAPTARSKREGTSSAGRSSASHGHVAASASHRQNDRYMEEFDAAYNELHAAAVYRESGNSERASSKRATTRQAALPATSSERGRDDLHSSNSKSRSSDNTAAVGFRPQPTAAVGNLDGAWLKGPVLPEGTLHAVSAQPLMCMSLRSDGREVVVGSSDHALYVIPVGASSASSTNRRATTASAKPRTLYSKKYGHTEWVTCVTHLRDHRVVSGGMDSKLCLWDASGVRCDDLSGHSGSVSLVLTLDDNLVISAGYDKTLRLWDVGKSTTSRNRDRGCVKVGTAPILAASRLAASLVTGDRDGSVHVVDIATLSVTSTRKNAHSGHTTSVLGSIDANAPTTFYSGGQDGTVCVWDTRAPRVVQSLALHVDATNNKRGAVGFLQTSPDDPSTVVTGGADGAIHVLDTRATVAPVFAFTEHLDFIYALELHGQLCLSGAGNGMLHVHDYKNGKLLYGLGTNQAAVRAIAATPTTLVAAGDDGGVMVYDMQ